jgi:hypothetical protein
MDAQTITTQDTTTAGPHGERAERQRRLLLGRNARRSLIAREQAALARRRPWTDPRRYQDF